jgi:rubrerythrin
MSAKRITQVEYRCMQCGNTYRDKPMARSDTICPRCQAASDSMPIRMIYADSQTIHGGPTRAV